MCALQLSQNVYLEIEKLENGKEKKLHFFFKFLYVLKLVNKGDIVQTGNNTVTDFSAVTIRTSISITALEVLSLTEICLQDKVF